MPGTKKRTSVSQLMVSVIYIYFFYKISTYKRQTARIDISARFMFNLHEKQIANLPGITEIRLFMMRASMNGICKCHSSELFKSI